MQRHRSAADHNPLHLPLDKSGISIGVLLIERRTAVIVRRTAADDRVPFREGSKRQESHDRVIFVGPRLLAFE